MRTRLGESLPSIQRFDVPIEQATTPSLTALKAYTLGLEERRRGRELESVAFFNQAIEIDREFASAYTTLSTVYGSLGEWRRSEEYARLANGVTQAASASASGCSSPTSTTTASPATRTAPPRRWSCGRRRIRATSRPANALALIYNRLGRYERAVAEAHEALRRSPGHPFPLSNLAFAYRALGRYAEARKIARRGGEARRRDDADAAAALSDRPGAGDGSAAAHLAWAKGKPREFDLVSAQAQAAAFQRPAPRGGRRSISAPTDMAVARGLRGTASGYAAHLAWTEALYRDPRTRPTASRSAHHRPHRRRGRCAGHGAAVPRRGRVRAGRPGDRSAGADRPGAEQRYPESTFVQHACSAPATRAAIALQRRTARTRPSTALEAAAPTEIGTVAGLRAVLPARRSVPAEAAYAEAIAPVSNGSWSIAASIRSRRWCRSRSSASPARRPRAGDRRRRAPRLRRAVRHLEDADADFPPLARRPRRVLPR